MSSLVTIVPMMGLSPLSHMGHWYDIGSKLENEWNGKVIVGISSNSKVFTDLERINVIKRQWSSFKTSGLRWYEKELDSNFIIVDTPGTTIASAYDSMPIFGEKTLHILVGEDRTDYGNNLKTAIESHKIPELKGGVFSSIEVLTPDTDREDHGLSGTKMRKAVATGDLDTFTRHIGPMFPEDEVNYLFNRTKKAISEGRLAIKRR